MAKELAISLTKSQTEFYKLLQDLDVTYPAFSGGPGTGKSYLMDLSAVTLGMHSSQANIYIYAPEHHHIRTIHVPMVEYWLDAFKIKHKPYNKQENKIEVTAANCGSFYFKPMDNANALVGYESYAAFIDELDTLDENNASDIWNAVIKRNRQQPTDVPKEYRVYDEERDMWVCANKIATFSTPEGYNFCYKKWGLDPKPGYQVVFGDTRDNPYATKQYIQSIFDMYPEYIAESYISGHWVNMRSSSVYFNYDPELHDSFEEILPGENLYIGCDFNVDNTSATIFVKRKGKEWHAVEELCGLKDAATLAEIVHNVYAKIGHKIYIYPDSTGKARSNANASISAINELEAKGFVIKANGHNFLVKDRVNAANNAFKQGWVFVNRRNCPMVSRCLSNQPYGKNNEPCKKTGYDHQNDATTYPLVFELGLRPKLFNIPFAYTYKS